MSVTSLSSYLVTKVKGISGVDSRYVFDYEDPTQRGFPWICITTKEWYHRYITNLQNEINYIFTIRIYQEITKTNMGASQAESNLRTLTDSVIAVFNSDNRLGGSDVYTRPIRGKTGYVQNTPIRFYELEVECMDVIPAVG